MFPLLVVPFGLLWWLIARSRTRLGFGELSGRGALVLAYLAFQVVVLGIAELSSLGHNFTRATVAGAWLVVTLVLVLVVRACRGRGVDRRSPGRLWSRSMARLGASGGEDCLWIAVVALILGALALEGLHYVPSNSDSLVYHLARVEHWIQDRSVGFFATHYLAQIDLAPLSEYNLAQVQLLAGSDRLDWSMQWVAAIVSVVGVSELARLLGGGRRTQIAAAVVCATIPTGVLLATSTENDYFAAAIAIGLLIVTVRFSLGPGWPIRSLALGLSVGLATMSKGTLTALFAPAVVAFVVAGVLRSGRTTGAKAVVARGVGAVLAGLVGLAAVAGPFVGATYALFGSASGPTSRVAVDGTFSINGMAANVVRSTAANFEVGNGVNGPDTYLSRAALPLLHQVYSLFGISPHDLQFSLGSYVNTFAVGDHWFNMRAGDRGADPWHLLLLVAASGILVVAVVRGAREARRPLLLAGALGLGYLLFSGATRWSQYNVRYELPILVAFSAVTAIALSRLHPWVTRIVLAGLVVACLPPLLSNADQPLLHPVDVSGAPFLLPYFDNIHQLGDPDLPEERATSYETVARVLAQSTCRRAGIDNWILYEYPLWVALHHEGWSGELSDVDVHNPSARLESATRPCAGISQQGPRYVTPFNGTVNVQESDLAVSLAVPDAVTVRAAVPNFTTAVDWARVLPGGGWYLAGFGHLPIMRSHSTVYVFARRAGLVDLQLHAVPGVPQPTVEIQGRPSQPAIGVGGTVHEEIPVHRGSNRVAITSTGSGNRQPILILKGVSLAPAGS